MLFPLVLLELYFFFTVLCLLLQCYFSHIKRILTCQLCIMLGLLYVICINVCFNECSSMESVFIEQD